MSLEGTQEGKQAGGAQTVIPITLFASSLQNLAVEAGPGLGVEPGLLLGKGRSSICPGSVQGPSWEQGEDERVSGRGVTCVFLPRSLDPCVPDTPAAGSCLQLVAMTRFPGSETFPGCSWRADCQLPAVV